MAIIRKALPALLAAAALGAAVQSAGAGADARGNARILKPLNASFFDVGAKQAVAYYQNERNTCKVTVVMADPYEEGHASATGAVRFNTSVPSGTSTRIETDAGPALALWCAPAAATLFVQTVDRVAYVAPAK